MITLIEDIKEVVKETIISNDNSFLSKTKSTVKIAIDKNAKNRFSLKYSINSFLKIIP